MQKTKEIFGDYFLKNDTLKPSTDFDDTFLRKGINVYEVLRVINYKPLFVEDHCVRFSRSLKGKNIAFFCHPEKLKEKLLRLIEKNEKYSGNIKIVYHFNEEEECFLIIYPVQHTYPTAGDFETGVDASLLEEERPDPRFKNWRPEFKKRVLELKKNKQVFEIILYTHDGIITEGSQSNLFFIRDNEIVTAKSHRILPGITRKYVYQICHNEGILINEIDFSQDELPGFQSAFLSGTSPKILPLRSIDDYHFYPDHPILRLIMDEYNRIIQDYISSF